MAHHLKGWTAIEYAEKHGGTLQKYTDPTERALKRVSIEKAKRVAREDPKLIHMYVRHGSGKNPTKRATRARVSRSLTKYVRNFTGTITRTGDGQVVIAGTGPKPKTAKNPKEVGEWAVMSPIQGDLAKPYTISIHPSREAALRAKRKVSSAKRPYIKKIS